MKHHFINLLIASAVVLSLLSGCIILNTENCPISMYINGDYWIGEEYTYHWGNRPHSFERRGDGFVVRIARSISGKSGSRAIFLRIEDESQLEIGKKYKIEKSEDTFIRFYVDEVAFYYVATDGWIVFTSIGNGEEPYRLSGEFEFTAVDENTGEVMEVREGKFENLLT